MPAIRRLTPRFRIRIALAVLFLAAGYLSTGWWQSPGEAEYETVAVDRGDIVKSITANGTLNPVVLVNVGTQVSGTIQHIRADFNSQVNAGQVLAELDPALFRAALDQSRASLSSARASLTLAENNASRSRALFGKGYIPKAEWDQALQAVASARAQVDAVSAQVRRDETNLRYSVIVSPVSGIVVSRNVDVGQTVAASFQTPTLFTIAEDLRRMQIDTVVAEADVGGIRVGQSVSFMVDAFPGQDHAGQVRQIRLNPQVLQNVVSYNVVVDVENPDASLLPGMTAFVTAAVARRENVLRIPAGALRYRPEAQESPGAKGNGGGRVGKLGEVQTVYCLRGGSPVPVPVRTGLSDGRMVELVSGELNPGDPLIIDETLKSKSASATAGSGGGGSFRFRMF